MAITINFKYKNDLIDLGVPILAGFLVFNSLVRTAALLPDILTALITGVFMGLFFKDLKRAAIAGFLVGSIGSFIFEFSPTSAAFIGLPNSIVFFFQGLIVMLGSILSKTIQTKVTKKLIIFFLMVFILMNFAINATVLNSKILQVASYEPPAEKYAFDGALYLKIFYLMKKGNGFYSSFAQAFDQDYRMSGYPPVVFGWRLPTIFYIWSLLLPANGAYLNLAFTVSSLVCLIAVYLVVKKFVEASLALIAPFLLAPYLLYGVKTWWFPFPEYWGMFFVVLCLVFYCYDKQILSIIFALLAVLVKELFLFLPVAGLLAGFYLRDRRRILLWCIPLIGFMFQFSFHYYAVKPYLQPTPFDISAWTHGGWNYFKMTAIFGMAPFARGIIMRWVFLLMATLGVTQLPKKERLFFGGLLLLPILAFLLVGTGKWGGYWGIIYMPFALIYVPLFLGYLHKKAFSQIAGS